MSRRTKGEGSYFTRTLPSGKTQYVYQYPNSRKRVTSCVSVAALKAKIRKMAQCGAVPRRHWRLADYLTRWLDEYAKRVAPSTHQWATYQFNAHIIGKPEANVILGTLKAPHVRALLDTITTLGPSSMALLRQKLKQALDDAVEDELIPRNPITRRGVKPPKVNKSKARAYDPQDALKLFAHIKNTPYEALILVMGLAGLRRGEALGLRWSDIDWERGTLTLEQSVITVPHRGTMIVRPKTEGSAATVDVGEVVLDALKRQRVRQKEMMLAAGPNWTNHDLVFTNCIGEPLYPRFVYTKIKKIQKAAGVPALGAHALRHTTATLQFASGADVKDVQKLLRHTLASTTMDTYIHWIPDTQIATKKRMDAIHEDAVKATREK